MPDSFKQKIDALYAFADTCDSLDAFVPALHDVLRNNDGALAGVTDSYRICTTDTGYTSAFALRDGVYAELAPTDAVAVTVQGSEKNLLAVFQRKLNPATGLLLGKIRVQGNKAALLKLASFL